MSLLQQTDTELDDAGRGEELTRGTSHIVVAAVIAAIVVTLAIWAYAVATREIPPIVGEVSRATVHFVHHESSGLDAAGNPMPKEVFNQALVFTHVRLYNQGKTPIFIRQLMTNVVLDDGIHTSDAATPNDYERLFQAMPELAPLHGTAIPFEATIAPGATVEGDFVSSFNKLSEQQWNARKGLNYSVSMQYQPNLTVAGPQSVTVQ